MLENHQLPELARQLDLPIDELTGHIDIIRHLDPKPGIRHNPAPSQYVVPDVYVRKVEDAYVADLNDDALPQLRVSPVYRRMLDKKSPHSAETRSYIKDKFRSALWLIKSVDQRQKTIHKVATSIITFQQEFLDHGIEHLRPLVLRDVANDIGMHESTVSRVVTNKYMHTPQGVFEMKYFFHSGIRSVYGESVSSVTIKQRVRTLVENEDPQKPLSDSRIVNVLQEEGLILARRTAVPSRSTARNFGFPHRVGANWSTDTPVSGVVERSEERASRVCPRSPRAQLTFGTAGSREANRWRGVDVGVTAGPWDRGDRPGSICGDRHPLARMPPITRWESARVRRPEREWQLCPRARGGRRGGSCNRARRRSPLFLRLGTEHGTPSVHRCSGAHGVFS